MSNMLPQFSIGQRCQPMQTTENVKKGIANACGVVVGVVNRNDSYQNVSIFLERGEFIDVMNYSLCHVDEDMYQGWKSRGIPTHLDYILRITKGETT